MRVGSQRQESSLTDRLAGSKVGPEQKGQDHKGAHVQRGTSERGRKQRLCVLQARSSSAGWQSRKKNDAQVGLGLGTTRLVT